MKWLECDNLVLDCEYVLYKTDTPEIFICTDQNSNRYLTIFEDGDEYLLTPISIDAILTLLDKFMSVSACIQAQKCSYLMKYYDGACHMNLVQLKNNCELLPSSDVYLDVSDDIVDYYRTCAAR